MIRNQNLVAKNIDHERENEEKDVSRSEPRVEFAEVPMLFTTFPACEHSDIATYL